MTEEVVFGGRYVRGSLLGSGTYGEVWKCTDKRLNRTVAVKLLHKGLEDFELLEAEGQALSELTHKNIVIVYDIGSDKKNGWLVVEFIDGPSLQARLAELLRQGKWLSFEEARSIVQQCLEALEFAHDKNRVHGDIKPGNILLPKTGEAKLGDFGVAKILGSEEREEYSAGRERRLGSASYAAPEVLKGQPRDFQSDLFSLGIVAYLLLTGQHPFTHKSGLIQTAELIKDPNFNPPKPSSFGVGVPEKYEKIVMRLLERDKSKRYSKAREVLDEWIEKPEVVQCPSCNAENPVSNKFCGQCAFDLRATREVETEPEAELSTSFALFTAGRAEEAIGLMKKSLDRNQDFAKGWSHLAYMLNNQRRYEEAEEAATRSIDVDPEQSRPYQTRGFARSNMGMYKEAISDFTEALNREPDERRRSLILYQRGYAKKLAGDFHAALEDADQALMLDSTNPKAQLLKRQLEDLIQGL